MTDEDWDTPYLLITGVGQVAEASAALFAWLNRGHTLCPCCGRAIAAADAHDPAMPCGQLRAAIVVLSQIVRQVTGHDADCVCRTTGCGHPASQHTSPLGACMAPGCTCGPGGWS